MKRYYEFKNVYSRDKNDKLKLEFYTLVLTDENGMRFFNFNRHFSNEIHGALYLTGYKLPIKEGGLYLKDDYVIADILSDFKKGKKQKRLSHDEIVEKFGILEVESDEWVVFEYLKHRIKD